jgi:hypothetical protein
MQALKTVTCCADASQSPRQQQQQQQQQQQGAPAWLARWLDVAVAASAAVARCCDETASACWPAAAGGSPLHLQVGGQQLKTTSAETEQRVVCSLSILHGAVVAGRGCGLACAAGWVRASGGAAASGRARDRGLLARAAGGGSGGWGRPCSRPCRRGSPVAPRLPLGKERPRGCGTCFLLDCHVLPPCCRRRLE